MAMAVEWREICKHLVLADGAVDLKEVKILSKLLKAKETGKIHPEGMTFLVELHRLATKRAKAARKKLTAAFQKYFYKSVLEHVSKDGDITAYEAKWLRETLFADKKIDNLEWKVLQTLDKTAKSKSPEFVKLLAECEASRKKKKK
ncbi:MAG: hypothetical protein ACKO23_21855 [Gemmataceae bacterium]